MRTVIPLAIANQLDLPRGKDVTVRGIGSSTPVVHEVVVDLAIDRILVSSAPVITADVPRARTSIWTYYNDSQYW